jgi:hypothetical protein
MDKLKYDEMYNVLARDLFTKSDVDDFVIEHIKREFEKNKVIEND